MTAIKRGHALVAGATLILLINAIALAGVRYNRSGEADSHLALSERELGGMPAYLHKGNSGLLLRLQWRMPGSPEEDGSRSPGWLSEAQMSQLGFHIPDVAECQPRCRHQASREVLVVLELDGPAYHEELRNLQKSVKQARRVLVARPKDKELQQRLEYRIRELDNLQRDTRLYMVDVGLDRHELRQRHPDRNRYAIVRGLVRPSRWGKPEQLRGYLGELSIERINVPKQWRALLEGLPRSRDKTTAQPGYRVEVAFGRRLEPWISGASTVAD